MIGADSGGSLLKYIALQMAYSVNLDEARQCLAHHGYKLGEYIGRGNFASVYTVTSARYATEVFCVKIVSLSHQDESSDFLSTYQAEFNTLVALVHPNIISVYSQFASAHFWFLVLEYCEGGSLSELIEKEAPMSPASLLLLSRQMLSAMSYLHASHFAHRDIKPANILIDKYGRPKLADFGFASSNLQRDSKICGSLPYQAPELINFIPGTDPVAADIWALGVTFYRMAFGQLPWHSRTPAGMASEISQAMFSFPPDGNKPFMAVIRAMLNRDPAQRKLVDDVLKMPFFSTQSPLFPSNSSPELRLLTRSHSYQTSAMPKPSAIPRTLSKPKIPRLLGLPRPSLLGPE
jgi:serine/threonine protein kinase